MPSSSDTLRVLLVSFAFMAESFFSSNLTLPGVLETQVKLLQFRIRLRCTFICATTNHTHEVKQCTICQRTNYYDTLSVTAGTYHGLNSLRSRDIRAEN